MFDRSHDSLYCERMKIVRKQRRRRAPSPGLGYSEAVSVSPAATPAAPISTAPIIEMVRVERPFTPKQIAEFYQISPATVRRLLRAGLPAVRVGQQIRFKLSDVDEFFTRKRDTDLK